jgi:hypothetical protein
MLTPLTGQLLWGGGAAAYKGASDTYIDANTQLALSAAKQVGSPSLPSRAPSPLPLARTNSSSIIITIISNMPGMSSLLSP